MAANYLRTPIWVLPAAFVAGFAVAWAIMVVQSFDPTWIPVISAIVGLVVAFTIPIWTEFFVKSPKLTIEIGSIKRAVSETITFVFEDDPELKILVAPPRRQGFWYDDEYEAGQQLRSRPLLEQIDARLEQTKRRLRDLPALIDERKREVETAQALNPTTLTRHEVARLNRPLSPEVEYDDQDRQGVIDAIIKTYEERLLPLEKELTNLQRDLPIAERKLELFKKDLVANKSLFIVSVSFINSGRSNTAVKVPGLLRVSIGEGNYIDIKLSLRDFENKSEITASGTQIAIFESSEISLLPAEDRDLINTYWGQSVRASILVEDVQGTIIRSNYIPFAEGLYQKIIYDRLARAASGE